MASNIAQSYRVDLGFRLLPFLRGWLLNQLVFQALVGSFPMIMILEFLAEHVHVLVAKDDKMIQTCLLNRLNESLDEGYRIRRSNGGTMRLDLGLFEHV